MLEPFAPFLIKLKIKPLPHFKGTMPSYQTALSSGFDVRAQLDQPLTFAPSTRVLVPTGLIFEIPKGFELQIRPRSGLALKKGLIVVNSPGTIDADYRGELKIILGNFGTNDILIEDQDRVAQVVLCPVYQADLCFVDEVDSTQRGEGGFGSTGK